MITREEYELLKECREQGYKWIARDEDGELYLYRTEPTKLSSCWLSFNIDDGIDDLCDGDVLFQCIKWEDEKPTKILDLIQDYEAHQLLVAESEKVVIPSFVAGWIESRKNIYTLKGLFSSDHMPTSVESWIACDNEKCELMAKAWIYGYEVEKEKLYTVQLKNGYHLCKYEGTGVRWLNMTEFNTADCYKLTKAEIESVDPRLMQFAVEVE